MKILLRLFILVYLTIVFGNNLYSNDLELTREFNLITSKNAGGYLKPLFTTIGEGFNTSLYNTAYHSNGFSFGLNLSVMQMFVPNSQRMYDAELPDYRTFNVKTAGVHDSKLIENFGTTIKQPTIYGGKSYSVFAAPQGAFPPDSFYKSVGFLEGNDISSMPGLPVLQLYLGLPTRSEIRFRYLSLSVQDAPLSYLTFGLTQNIDKEFGFQEPDNPLSYGFTTAYHSLSRSNGIDVSSFAFGLIASNKFDDDFQVYGGLQFETFSGNIELVRKNFKPEDVLNSPYSEIKEGRNLKVDVESYNSFRLTAGAAYDLEFFRFHGDISYAAQPVVNLGVSIKILEHEETFYKPTEYFPKDPNDQRPPILAYKDFTNPYLAKSSFISVVKPKEWAFDISLKMNGIYESSVKTLDTIVIEEFESRQTRALLPYLFYNENESAIPAKYNQITKENSEKFSFSELSGKTSLESYYDVLNVIALRLKQKSNATITLTGTNNGIGPEKNNLALSKSRAENIKKYLVDVWSIDESRIKVAAVNLPKVASNNKDKDGQAENRRVEITADDVDVLAPVFIIDTLLRIKPETIQYLPSVNSEAGLARWSINTSSDGVEFKTFSGNSEIQNNLEWQIINEGIKKRLLKNNLKTIFTASDKENQVRNFTANNPVKIISVKDKRLNATKDTSLNMYNLILFDFDKSELGPMNKRITDFIKSEITPETNVTIYGYTDRIGKDDYNMKLSKARAESTGKALGGHPFESVGLGKSKVIFDNDLPEGRFYSRTVVVEAKVPIN